MIIKCLPQTQIRALAIEIGREFTPYYVFALKTDDFNEREPKFIEMFVQALIENLTLSQVEKLHVQSTIRANSVFVDRHKLID